VNNVYIFPGMSFGAVVCAATTLPDELFLVAAEVGGSFMFRHRFFVQFYIVAFSAVGESEPPPPRQFQNTRPTHPRDRDRTVSRTRLTNDRDRDDDDEPRTTARARSRMATQAVANSLSEQELAEDRVVPAIDRIRAVSQASPAVVDRCVPAPTREGVAARDEREEQAACTNK
jgi:hypothetical protein